MPKSFKYWFADEVETTFGIKKKDSIPVLEEWLNAKPELDDTENYILFKLQNALKSNADAWNEEELKVFFIAHVLELVKFEIEVNEKKLKPFLDRMLSFSFQNETYKGEVDFIIAMGRQFPRNPYFFIHEYKQETKKDNDPLGQLLMGLLAAKYTNNREEPIYGAYIVGRNWFFVALDGNEYAVSLAYDATQEDIFQIAGILQKAKRYIISSLQS